MPWKESSVMEEKLRFILEHEAGEESMRELCQRYDISRATGYRTLQRYRASGDCWPRPTPRTGMTTRQRRRSSSRCWSCGRRTCAGDRGN
jgi:transposase